MEGGREGGGTGAREVRVGRSDRDRGRSREDKQKAIMVHLNF